MGHVLRIDARKTNTSRKTWFLAVRRKAQRSQTPSSDVTEDVKEHPMIKLLLWAVGIIFVIGLLVVFGVIDLIF
ncbi:hypothetical protein IZ6_10840 [Terrihabitans soli]|uniref:Uncharacterized protein n=1 Tax=Terrihabitans soli TaxID=708113 RepID=A0A6S6QN19_9HYPH|nr:hypothetical protein [Terrihabitans soli]BCJ90349.1 hypothetical protein IZ6_10840 [Terrihabitans soli]